MTLFVLALCWLLGIGLGSIVALAGWQWLALAALCLAAGLILRHHRSAALFFLLLAAFAGAARFQSTQQPAPTDDVRRRNDSGQVVTLVGWVADDPDGREAYTGLRLEVQSILQGDSPFPASGVVRVHAPRRGGWAYGDRVHATGLLETPPEFPDFSYRDYLARQGVHSLMARASVERVGGEEGNAVLRALYAYRRHALGVLGALFPEPEASLLSGILLGVESGIPADLRQAYDATGTAHIIAISGFNIAIIAGLFGRLFTRWLGARRGAWAALAGIAVYTALVGADASVVRAALMAGLVILARRLGRQNDALAALGAAALLMTAVNPMTLWDVGFQLSFGATLGLVLYAEPLQRAAERLAARWFEPKRAARLAAVVGEYTLFTFAAQVTTLPLTALYFHRFSVVAWVANPLVLPAQPAVMVLGGLAALAGSLWLPLGRPLAWVAWPFIAYTNRLVEAFAGLPSASIPLGETGLGVLAAYFLVLFGVTLALPRARARWPDLALPSLSAAAALSGLAFFVFLTWRAAVDRPDGLLHVTLLDVGGGGAILIESPTGRSVLIDSGPSPVALASALGRRLPLGSHGIDVFVYSGSPGEACLGMPGLEARFRPDLALLPWELYRPACRALEADFVTGGTRIVRGEPGLVLVLGAGAQLRVIDATRSGLALELAFGRSRFLLPLGADPDSLARLLRSGTVGQAHVLVLAGGGHAAVNPPQLFQRTQPVVAAVVIDPEASGSDLSSAATDALRGVRLLRADHHGWIEFRTDGASLWIEAAHAGP
jgi:competence protein ComEC